MKRIAAIILVMLWFAPAAQAASAIYWGAYISGTTYGFSNPPWDTRAWDTFESHTGKKISVFHWGLPWYNSVGWPQGYYPFVTSLFDTVRLRGAIPFLDWGSWDQGLTSKTNQPQFTLSSIISGTHDAYITQWATSAKNWGQPFFLRFDWEMNGSWFPWSEAVNGNSSGQYIQAWRHVHDIFTRVGTVNVTWVWCPNAVYSGSLPLSGLYPGDNYVDWTCADNYNWGTNNPTHLNVWQDFSEIFKPTYDALLALAPTKPIFIGETASSEFGGSKSNWITDMLSIQLPTNFPAVKGWTWFNWNTDNADWVIETSPSSQQSFADSIITSYYASGVFANLATSPIVPLNTITYGLPDLKYIATHYLITADPQYFPDNKINALDSALVISHLP